MPLAEKLTKCDHEHIHRAAGAKGTCQGRDCRSTLQRRPALLVAKLAVRLPTYPSSVDYHRGWCSSAQVRGMGEGQTQQYTGTEAEDGKK